MGSGASEASGARRSNGRSEGARSAAGSRGGRSRRPADGLHRPLLGFPLLSATLLGFPLLGLPPLGVTLACAHGEPSRPSTVDRPLPNDARPRDDDSPNAALSLASLPASAAWSLQGAARAAPSAIGASKPRDDDASTSTEGSEAASTADAVVEPSPDDPSGPFRVVLRRPYPEGARFRITHDSEARTELTFDVQGNRRQQDRRQSISLVAEATVRAATDGRIERLEVEIEELELDAEEGRRDLLDRGTRVDARYDGQGQVDLSSDEPLDEETEKALRAALPSERRTEHDPYAPDEPQPLGGMWDVELEELRTQLAEKGLDIPDDGAQLEGRLLGLGTLGPHRALRIEFRGTIEDAQLTALPTGSQLESSNFETSGLTLVPIDPTVPVAQRSEFELTGSFRMRAPYGPVQATIEGDIDGRHTTVYELLE